MNIKILLGIEIFIFFIAYIASFYIEEVKKENVLMFGMLIVVTYVGNTLFKDEK